MSEPPARRARAAVFGLALALIAVFVAWHCARFSAPTAALISSLGAAPWLALAPRLARGSADAHLLGLLLTTPYLGYALMEVLANPGARPFAAATLFIAFALAVALVAGLRLSRRAAAERP